MLKRDPDTIYALHIGKRFWPEQVVLFVARSLSQVLRYPFVILLRDLIAVIMAATVSFNEVVFLTAEVSLLLILIFALTMFSEVYGTVLYAKIFTSIWKDLASKIARLPGLNGLSAGEYLGRFSDALSVPAVALLPVSLSHVIGFIVIAYTLYVLSPLLSAIILTILIPLSMVVMWFFGSKAMVRQAEARKLYDTVMSDFKNLIDGLTSFKALGKTHYLIEKFGESVNRYFSKYKSATKGFIMAQRFVSLIWWFSPIISIIIGLLLVSQGLLTIPNLMAFAVSINSIMPPLDSLIRSIRNWLEAKPSIRRVRTFMELPEEASGNVNLSKQIKHVMYDKVFFRYDKKGEYILKGVNLEIRRGECVAIVGSSGTGKSTLVKLLPRLIEPEKGLVGIDGIDVREFNLNDLRRKVIYVNSHAYLLNATIRENIALGDEISDHEIWAALKKCNVDFVNSLEDTIQEWGQNLSEGQRQRIALARAIVRKPEVLILDEALSGVDSKTEGYIISNIKAEVPILVIVSHRLSTITSADRIIVLSKGSIVCQGKHHELIETCPEYKELVARQLIKED